MKNLGAIIKVNLLVLLGYMALIMIGSYAFNRGGSGYDAPALYYAFLMMYALGMHLMVLFIVMIVKFVRGEKELGLSHLVSWFVVAVIGFSSCLGGGAMLDGF